MNIYEIAKKAGVSRSTVSRVLNGAGYVSENARKKVTEVIEAEHFVPNPAARALVTKRNLIIGIVIPDTIQNILDTENSHYYSTLLQGITETAYRQNYATLLWAGSAAEAKADYHKRVLKNLFMDGLLLVASVATENLLLNQLIENKKPWVQIGRPLYMAESISYVGVDNAGASEQAVRHLHAGGRRRIATITGTFDNADSQDRLTGYKLALAALGLPVDEKLIVKGKFSREAGYHGMKLLLEQKVDGVFAASDLIAMGALQAIHEAGLRVPDDIALIGFDDLPLAAQSNPPLTTVRQPIAEKAARATTVLLDLIEQRCEAPVQVLLPTQLIIRESA